MAKHYYTALMFNERPDLHLTLRYYKKVTKTQKVELIADLERHSGMLPDGPFVVQADEESWFGPFNTIRVLEVDELPFGLMEYQCAPHTRYPTPKADFDFRPHITCDDPRVQLIATHVALMCKNTEIIRWNL